MSAFPKAETENLPQVITKINLTETETNTSTNTAGDIHKTIAETSESSTENIKDGGFYLKPFRRIRVDEPLNLYHGGGGKWVV